MRRALYGGLRAGGLATAGWLLPLVIQEALNDPFRLSPSVIGVLLHIFWHHRGGESLFGIRKQEEHSDSAGHEKATPLINSLRDWRGMAIWVFATASGLTLFERGAEYLSLFLASALTLFPAGVVLTFAVIVFPSVWSLLPKSKDLSDAVFKIFLRIVCTIPMSLIAAAIIASVTSILASIMTREPAAGFHSFLWWWVPAAFGFILWPGPFKGPTVAILLLLAVGAADSWWLSRAGLRAEEFHLRERTSADRLHLDFELGFLHDNDRKDLASTVLEQFDPRHFLSVVGDPFVPSSFSFRVEDKLPLEKEESYWSKTVRRTIQTASHICGCPESISQEEIDQSKETFYRLSDEEGQAIVFEERHGSFCNEMRLGLGSGMIRSWFILVFLGWGIAQGIGASAVEEYGWKALRSTTLITALALVGGALVIRLGIPTDLALTANVDSPVVTLQSSGGEVDFSWHATLAKYKPQIVPGLPKENILALTTKTVRYLIPSNGTDMPVWYTFTVEARGFLDSRLKKVSIVVEPPEDSETRIPARLNALQDKNEKAAFGMAVDASGSMILTGFAPEVSNGAQIEDPSNAFVTSLDPEGTIRWRQKLRVDPSKAMPVAFDGLQNVYVGSSEISSEVIAEPLPPGIIDPKKTVSRAVVRKLDFATGNVEWEKPIGVDDDEFLFGLATDDAGNVYAAGKLGAWMDNPNSRVSAVRTETDGFLAKFDSSGNPLWLVQFGTNGDDGATGVAVGSDGAIYVTGFTERFDYFNREESSANRLAFLARYDAKGNGIWVRKYGSFRDTSILPQLAMTPDKTQGVYVAGGEGDDSFLGKYDVKGNLSWMHEAHFLSTVALASGSNEVYQARDHTLAIYGGENELKHVRYLPDRRYSLRLLVSGPAGLYGAGNILHETSQGTFISEGVFAGKLPMDNTRTHR